MEREYIVDAFVKFKNKKIPIRIAKTTDYDNLYEIESKFNEHIRKDVEELFFIVLGHKCNTVFDVIEYTYEYDAGEYEYSYYD